MTELSNLCGLAQVRAVKKSCHAALVFSQLHGAIPGSWLGESWLSALLIGICFHLHRDLAVMSRWFCYCFLQDPIYLLNLSEQKLPFLLRARPSLQGFFCFVWFLGVFWFCFVVFWTVCFALWFAPQFGLVGLRPAILSFDFPMREHTGHCTICSTTQTLCYNLARAEKAKDGKNNRVAEVWE